MTDEDLYGGEWHMMRKKRLQKDNRTCYVDTDQCQGKTEVHHIIKAKEIDDPEKRHALDNLVTLCKVHHQWLERLSAEEQHEILNSDQPEEHAPPCLGHLNPMDRWILDYLSEHEWATPQLLRTAHGEEHEMKSRQWVSDRVRRLEEHDHLEPVHSDAHERQLVDDPREK